MRYSNILPIKRKENNMHDSHITVTLYETADSIARIIPNWAEHGMAKKAELKLSFFLFSFSSILLLKTAIVPHPSPKTIGKTAFPFSPTKENNLFRITESLGRYPESSNIPKNKRKL
jgi:hypothetical protein